MNFSLIFGLHGLHSFYIIHHVIEALVQNPKEASIITAAVLIIILICLLVKHYRK